MKLIRKAISTILVLSILLSISPSVYGLESNDDTSEESFITESSVIWGNDYVREHIIAESNGVHLDVVRTTYSNNITVLQIAENEVTTTITHETDYARLCQNLNNPYSSSTFGRVSGYTYTYIRTDTDTAYYTPDNLTYSTLLGLLSTGLGVLGIPGATIVGIVGIILGFNGSVHEIKTVTYRHWHYTTETASGEFLSYYCEYNVYTYVKTDDGSWVHIDTKSGDFDSFDIY